MKYISVDIDVSDVLDELSDREARELYSQLHEEFGTEPAPLNLQDPATRLEVIVALREMGYTVEPR